MFWRAQKPAPGDVPHKHKCPNCGKVTEHTPNQSWEMGRWESHTCSDCGTVNFKPTEGEHDVDS